MNHDTNAHLNDHSNNQLNDQFMGALQETYPAAQKEQLKARLNQIEPDKRWWRLTTMKQKQSLKNQQIVPRLAGVVALLLIAAVSFAFLNNTTNTNEIAQSENPVDTQPEQEAIAKQQAETDSNIEPIVVNGVIYLWAAGEGPTVPETVPTYKFTQTSVQTVSEMESVAEAMGATNPEHYNSDAILFMHNDGELPMHEFRGENGLTVLFTPFGDSGTSFPHIPSFAEVVRTTQLANDPLPFEQQREQLDAIVEGLITTPYLVEQNSDHISTLSPVVEIEGVDAPVPVYVNGFSPLSQFVFDKNGEIALIWWRSIDIETTGETALMPPLDALSVANRHQTKWELGTNELIVYREGEPQVGDTVTLIGTATTSVHAENGAVEAVFHPTDISGFLHFQKAYLLRGDTLKDMRSFSTGVYSEINGIVREDSDGTQYIDVVDWDYTTLSPSRKKCRAGVVEQTGDSAVFTTDEFAFSATQNGFEAGTYRLPELPSRVNVGERIAICAEDWSEETVDWESLQPMPNTDMHSNERTITSVRLTYQLGDKFTNYDVTPFWEFQVESIQGYPFTLMVRAD